MFNKDLVTIQALQLDCSGSLVDAGFTPPPPFPYNSAGNAVTLSTDYTAYFTHTQLNDCILTQCALMDPGCLVALAAQPDVVLGASPYGLTATEINPVGYLLNFCIQCTITPTGLPPITFNKDALVVE